MSLATNISDEDISINAAVTGDVTPGSTQLGVMTKFRDQDDDLKSDLEAARTAFALHDHGTAGDGTPLGTGGADSFSSGAVDETALGTGSVTGAKISGGSIATAHMTDDTVTKSKFGTASTASLTVPASGSISWSHGLSSVPIFHIEGDNTDYISIGGSGSTITFYDNSGASNPITVVYRGS